MIPAIRHIASIIAASMAMLATMSSQPSERVSPDQTVVEAEREQRLAEFTSRLGPLEAALVRLHQTKFESSAARQQAIRQWYAENGPAFEQELEARRESKRPELERLQAEARARLDGSLADRVAAGKLGPLEAEFVKLTRTPFESVEQRRAAIEQWQARNGAAFDAERERRRVSDAPRLAALQAEALARRQQHIADALQGGRIGPREAQFLRLRDDPQPDPTARAEVVRAWLATHGAELNAELEARRERALAAPSNIGTPE